MVWECLKYAKEYKNYISIRITQSELEKISEAKGEGRSNKRVKLHSILKR